MGEIRAKIVCTLGPASNDYKTVKQLLLAGMDVARLNFSHGDHTTHLGLIDLLRKASRETGKQLAIMMDLQGPKIRVGALAGGAATLKKGARYVITTRNLIGNDDIVSTTYKGLAKDVKPGDVLLLDDGMMSLRVTSRTKTDVVCKVTDGGILKNNKGINIPGAGLSVETISRKDRADTDFAIANGADFLAMSFVRHPDDVRQMRHYLARRKASLPIVTKIEKPQAIDFIDEIIDESDAVMVARGDLGVEMSAETVPGIQKMIISKCNLLGVPVITATQMLDSMINNPRPTRAEASDVANAILDGSDAVMLSGESAAGKYPVESVKMMRRIIAATERANPPVSRLPVRRAGDAGVPVNEGVAITACSLAEQVDARAIACVTLSGSMARSLAKHRPGQQIYAIGHQDSVARLVCLTWGVRGIVMKDLTMDNVDDAIPEITAELVSRRALSKGDKIVLTAGLPFSARRATNMVRVDDVT